MRLNSRFQCRLIMTMNKIILLALIGVILQACGQSGALYLPDNTPPPVIEPKQDQ
jgi:predicted small lipoprotein YifL